MLSRRARDTKPYMKALQPCSSQDSMVCPDEVVRASCSRAMLVVLTLTIVVSSLSGAAAQTRTSHAAIRDHLRKAAQYLKASDPTSAAKEFDAVLALDPTNAEAYANLGVIAFFQRDYQKASQNLRKA